MRRAPGYKTPGALSDVSGAYSFRLTITGSWSEARYGPGAVMLVSNQSKNLGSSALMCQTDARFT